MKLDEMQMDSNDAILRATTSNDFVDFISPSDTHLGSRTVPFSNSCEFSGGNASESSAKRLSAIDEDFENLLKCEPCLLDPRLLQRRSSTSAPSRYGNNELLVPKSNSLRSSTPSLLLVGDNRSLRHTHPSEVCLRNKLKRIEIIDVETEHNDHNTNFPAFNSVPCVQTFPIGPPPSLKQTTMTSRTQMRQHLQKQQMQEEENRRKIAISQQLNAPSSLPSEPLNIQTHSIPPASEVPIQILQVRSQLENPTRYHVVKCQQRQVIEYLNGKQMSPVETRSLPTTNFVAATRTATTSNTNALAGGTLVTSANVTKNNAVHFSAPNSPQSVAMESSAATSVTSDVDDILEFINLENMTADDSGHPNTLPNLGLFGDVLNLQPMNGKTSSSCPADLPPIKEECPMTPAQFKALVKDRQKKDTHNMIERRRRFNINDRIKELGDLLPKNNERYFELVRDVKQNKGTILKASVDYIKRLKDDLERMKKNEIRQRQLELQNRELLLLVKQLEETAQQHGVPISKTTWHTASINDIMNVLIKQEPETLPIFKQQCDTSPMMDLMDEDYGAINGDPMLSSPPDGSTGSTNLDDTLSHDSMDLLP